MIMTLENAGVDPGGCGRALVNPRNPTADRVRRGAWGPHGWPRETAPLRVPDPGKRGVGRKSVASGRAKAIRVAVAGAGPRPRTGRGLPCVVLRCPPPGGRDRSDRQKAGRGRTVRKPGAPARRGRGAGCRARGASAGLRVRVARKRPRNSAARSSAAKAAQKPWPTAVRDLGARCIKRAGPWLRPGRRGMRHGYRQKVCRPPIRHPGRRTAHQLLSALTRTPRTRPIPRGRR